MVGAEPAVEGAIAFCDLAGFTSFTADRGDAAAIGLIETFGRHVAEVLPDGGRIVNRMGDGLFLHFADVHTALCALLTLTERCSALSTPDTPLWVRTGVHVGPAQRLGEDLIGHHVNIAARIGELAAATEVLASEAAREASDDPGVRFDALGPVFVKGLPDPLRLFRASSVDTLL